MKLFHGLILLPLFCHLAFADLPFKKKRQEFATQRPGEVAATLRDGTAVQRNDLATELRILAPSPSHPGADTNSPCVNFRRVEERKAVLRAGAENEILLAESSECDSTYILVFDKAPRSEWRHVQTLRLPSRLQRPEISFVELIQTGVSEITVHHEIREESGSARQEDFLVLKMVGDRVEVVLDATEHSEITLTNRSPGETDNLRQSQTSTFSLLKSPPGAAAAYSIVEKEVLTDNKTENRRYRLWTWDPELERFRPSPFDGGDIRQAPLPQKKPAAKPAAGQPQESKPK
jgi:hypothetical protein